MGDAGVEDELVTGLLPASGLRVLVATTTALSREGRRLHGLAPTSAALLAQGLTAGLLYAALQKEKVKVNLQVECDGPLLGLFVDAHSEGTARGYVKNPLVAVEASGAFRWRPALGNAGYLSVLRELEEGEFFRSSVALEALDLALDMETFFRGSEQVRTFVALEAVSSKTDSLEAVAGVLLQPLPDGDGAAFEQLTERLRRDDALAAALRSGPLTAAKLAAALIGVEKLDLLSRVPLSFRCNCSIDRVRRAVAVMGKEELEDILRTERRAEATCQFCSTRYVVEEPELRELLAKL